MKIDSPLFTLEEEAKALVRLCFRDGPIEDIHADGRISQQEMKEIMKHAVNMMYHFLKIKEACPEVYAAYIKFFAPPYWDDPDPEYTMIDYEEACKKYRDNIKKRFDELIRRHGSI